MNRVTAVLLIFSTSCLFPDSMQSQTWQYLGLAGKGVQTFVLDTKNSNIIYAGSHTTLYRTTNSGLIWDTLTSGIGAYRIQIHPSLPSIVYIAGAGPNGKPVMKSTDFGLSWIKADSGIKPILFAENNILLFDCKHPDTLYFATSSLSGGRFYKSTNAGTSWAAYADSSPVRNGIISLSVGIDSTNLLLAGADIGSGLLKSTNGGQSWASIHILNLGSISDIGIDARSNQRIYLLSSGLKFSTTLNGGATWESSTADLPSGDTTIFTKFINIYPGKPNNIFMYVYSQHVGFGFIAASSDYGKTWRRMSKPPVANIMQMSIFPSGETIYACGEEGLFKFNGELLTIYKPLINSMQVRLFNNFPNPFNPETTIEYRINKKQHIHLEIFDVLGNKIKILVNQAQESGNYSLKFNAKDLASGIYFYKLTTENEIYFKKMVLQK